MRKQIHLLIFDDHRDYRVEGAFFDKGRAEELATKANEQIGARGLAEGMLGPQCRRPYDVLSVNIEDYDRKSISGV